MTSTRPILAFLLASLFVIAGAGDGLAKVVISESTRYYSINGRDGLEVSKAMLSGGARNISLRHAIAATSTRFSVGNAKLDVRNGRCVAGDVVVRLEIQYLYPRWDGKNRASGNVRAAWDRFYAELLRHEQTHGRFAKEMAKTIEKELERVTGTPALGCSDYMAKADRIFSRLTDRLKKKQIAFDAAENRKSSRISRLQVALLKAR